MTTQVSADDRFGPWRILRPIGRGGMGQVLLAEHVDDGTQAALKTVSGANTIAAPAIRREIHLLRRLRHPGVVRFLDDGLRQGLPWYAMAYVDGPSLSDRLDTAWGGASAPRELPATFDLEADAPMGLQGVRAPMRDRLAPTDLVAMLSVFRQICQTLAWLHGEGVVHRDLKPDNVLFGADGVPILVDFGVTRHFAGSSARERLDELPRPAGTLAYMAPEQILGLAVDARADLYAVGCMLYEAITGRPPFIGRNTSELAQAQLQRDAAPPSEAVRDLPPAIDHLLAGLLQKDPAERTGYADDVARALADLGAVASPLLGGGRRRSYLYRPRFTGRQRPLSRLVRRARATLDGEGGCLCVVGPSGTGKTRLVFEAAAAAARDKVTVLFGACEPLDMQAVNRPATRGGALHPFAPLLRDVADRCRQGGPAVSERLLGPLGTTLEQVEPSLVDVPRTLRPQLPVLRGDAAQERLLQALVDVVSALATEVPLMLVVDDLQWADDATLTALSLLRDSKLPALIVGTARSEALSPAVRALIADPTSERLDVEPLGEDEVVAVMRDMLGRHRAPATLERFVVHHCQGNPFYAAEYLHAAVALGALSRERASGEHDGLWTLVLPAWAAGPPPLPEEPQSLVTLRLDGLNEAARRVARAGAVLGRSFDQPTVTQVAGVDAEAGARGLESLLAERVVEEAGDGHLAFVHDKLRELAYQGAPDHERKALHARAAEAIAANPAGVDHAVVSMHWLRADEPVRAWPYLVEGGALGLERGDIDGSEHMLDLALTALERGDVVVDDVAAARARCDHAVAVLERGDVGRSLLGLRQAIADLDTPIPSSTLGWVWALSRELTGQLLSGLLRRLRRPVDAPTRARLALIAELADHITGAAVLRAESGLAVLTALIAANRAERAGDDAALPTPYAFLGMIAGVTGPMRLSRRYLKQLASVRPACDDLAVLTRAAAIEAFHHTNHCEWEEALAIAGDATRRATDAGSFHHARFTTFNCALVYQEMGDYDATRVWTARLAAQTGRGGSTWGRLQGRVLAARQAFIDGHLDEARQAVAEVLDAVDVEQELGLVTNALGIGALAAWCADDRRDAFALARRAEHGLAQMGQQSSMGMNALIHVPDVRLEAWARATTVGEAAEHRAALQPVIAQAASVARLIPLARAASLRHAGGWAIREGRTHRGLSLLRAALRQATLSRQPYERARAALAIAELDVVTYDERRAAADVAYDVFGPMGTPWVLARLDALDLTQGPSAPSGPVPPGTAARPPPRTP